MSPSWFIYKQIIKDPRNACYRITTRSMESSKNRGPDSSPEGGAQGGGEPSPKRSPAQKARRARPERPSWGKWGRTTLRKPSRLREQRRAGAPAPPWSSRGKTRRRCQANAQPPRSRNPPRAAAFPDGRIRDGPARLLPQRTSRGPSSSFHRRWKRAASRHPKYAIYHGLITLVDGNSWAWSWSKSDVRGNWAFLHWLDFTPAKPIDKSRVISRIPG